MKPSAAGKGDDCRIANFKQYRDNYDAIFKKKKECQCVDCFGDNPAHDPDCEYMLELTQDWPESVKE